MCLVTADRFPCLALEPSTPLVIGTLWDEAPYDYDNPGKELLLIAPSAIIPNSTITPSNNCEGYGVFALLADLPRKQDYFGGV